jgi:hypothetical protein
MFGRFTIIMMNLLKKLLPFILIKKLYAAPYASSKKPTHTDAEQDAISDVKADR